MDLDALLRRALESGATDIHLKVGQPPVLRCQGSLERLEGPPLGEAELGAALAAVTDGAAERLERFHRCGELDVAYTALGSRRFRVNVFRQRDRLSFAFRVVPDRIPSFEGLRLPPAVQQLAEERRGLVLVTGASGAGKSTTLAAMIDFVNRTCARHIVTIEDPIEFVHADQRCIVNQREVGLDTSSFSTAIHAVLRQDPDVILVGELRDAETAETVLQAAQSGHLVLSTAHAIGAAETVGRLLDLFPASTRGQARNALAETLRGVVSQRLLPAIRGGRVPAVEVMIVTARIEELIRKDRAEEITDAIADRSAAQMQTFTQSLQELVFEGLVESEDAAAAATNRHDFLLSLDQGLKARAAARRAREAAVPVGPRRLEPQLRVSPRRSR